ncbi:nucleotidyl transferase AbiEii/AbiGii toxin family protein [Campylobacter helveticus]|uniref:nucleotidyl transferase AbiEii/AbiGii toxin family protein n=1 Tax=Campylobacter helveticus TaxID=28898 RepID=UPI0009C2A42A|nr:nucleotidyl transferase AbiEii/AbiGii toxin family protein [Campylobacter helveticus]ARE81378.1 nucleotidyl transferase, AbiEii toxin, type IV TA system [Campylobacter helveticus]MCR2055258.1 nucleotidyl transferase AbiEii/AbiGii toxin family protein [Campylobacter helveticus]MCR2062069.1 nucleotidyl transferase AbiEii/AbiGii toxin family protein [Campylobacter helveticus]SMC22246.1 Nucleotidyl transferase AbiEii toxin, Type IV TA system [Campylobacter helveticus]SUW87701.1 Nucleotidyl tran
MNIEKFIEQNYPRNLKDTIFKELMHYEILESLFNISDIQKTLVFQGGTALRLCYKNNRYSEDLDFVVHKDEVFHREFMDYFKAIFSEKILKKYELEAEIYEPKEEEKRVQRWSARVYLPNRHKKSKINIEIANIPSHDNSFEAIANNYEALISKRIFVQVESKEEILADKIIALSQRPYLKFRDLWDIEWLINQGIKINNELVKLKIKDYSCNNFKEALEKRKEELNNPMLENDFLVEMSRFLNPEVFHQIKNFHFFNSIKKIILQICDELLQQDFNDENLNLQTTNTRTHKLRKR